MEYLNVDILRENLDELISRTQTRTQHLIKGQSHLSTRRLIRSILLAALRSLQEQDISYLNDRLVQAALDNIFQRIEFQEVGELGSIVLGVIADFLEESGERGATLLDQARPVINALNNETTRYELQVRFNRITQNFLNRQIRELTLLERVNQLEPEAFTEPRQEVWDRLLQDAMEIMDASDGVIFLKTSLFELLTSHFHYTSRNPDLLDQTGEIFNKLAGNCIDPDLVPDVTELSREEPCFNPSLDSERMVQLIQQYHPGTEEYNAGRPQTNLDVDNPNPLLAFCDVSSYINLLMSRGEEIYGLILVVKDEQPYLSDNDYAFLETLKNNLLKIAENIVLNHQLSHMAVTDPLTEIYNRRHFEQLLEQEVNRAERYSSPLSMAMVDIDHFKDFNDTYGHMVGDQVLKHVCNLMEENLRASEVIARYGGEEFAVLMPETDLNSAELVGEKIRSVIEENPFQFGDAPLTITVSVGVSSFPRFSDDPDELVDSADEALYMAKEEGRNQVCSYREVTQAEAAAEEAPSG